MILQKKKWLPEAGRALDTRDGWTIPLYRLPKTSHQAYGVAGDKILSQMDFWSNEHSGVIIWGEIWQRAQHKAKCGQSSVKGLG